MSTCLGRSVLLVLACFAAGYLGLLMPAVGSLLLNWFESKGLSSGIVEGFNNKAKLTMRKADGFKTFENIQIALFHQLEKFPEPESTHRFC